MVWWDRSTAFADVEDVIASNENLAKLALTLAVHHLLSIRQLKIHNSTNKFMYSSFDWRMPRNYQPHFNITLITLP